MSGKKGMVHYDLATKIEALRLHGEEGISYRIIAERLGIRDPERIRKWISQYRAEGEAGLCKKSSGRPRKKPLSQEAYIQKLEMENELLKKYHTELRKLMPARRDIGLLNTTGEDIQ
ncbi:MAG: transposase [Chloroflexi bacterium]|nr:transposase [Chloroflexota bacterium]